jgi:protein SCO1/2
VSSTRFQKSIWGVLVIGIIAVVVAFILSPPLERLPAFGLVQGFTLTNQIGEAITLDSLNGKVWVANVIFSRCPTQCRRLSAQMEEVQRHLPRGVRLVSLTADPGYDSPKVLERYGEKYHTDPAKWWFLTGPKSEVYRVAVQDLKFSVMETGDDQTNRLENLYIHSTSYTIVDRHGRLRGVVQGENEDAPAQILRKVKLLASEH